MSTNCTKENIHPPKTQFSLENFHIQRMSSQPKSAGILCDEAGPDASAAVTGLACAHCGKKAEQKGLVSPASLPQQKTYSAAILESHPRSEQSNMKAPASAAHLWWHASHPMCPLENTCGALAVHLTFPRLP
eukprot:1159649-Pelagomonas_calceolata.AAC.16